MSQKTIRIASELYFHLHQNGGDKLIAIYSTLKHFKNGDYKYYAYTAKNNKFVSCYSLLRAKTNLSLSTLKKYVPVLIDMELLSFHENGDVILLGGEKTKELYNSYKMIPIEIGKNIIETTLNCYKIKVHSAEKQQLNQIRIKQNRSVLLSNKSNTRTNKEYKAICRLEKRYGLEITVNDKTVLSNQGFGMLKNGEDDKKSLGSYWKTKLVKNNFIKTTRQYDLGEKMSYETYLQFKMNYSFRGLTYVNGRIARETVSKFSVVKPVTLPAVLLVSTPSPIKDKVKPLGYLSFDFVAWMANK